MEAKPLILAAQYLRMSTEDQQYSLVNQEASIQTYAEKNGYVVVATYRDAGKSGITIREREGLRKLLSDVTAGPVPYKIVLVYDVSRWGRFQDVDEAAHYEFLCKSSGVPVCYCAEQFDNDGSFPSTMMKALKRTMAAEYSRELGIKVTAGQRRLALLGFRVVGMAGYGLRRMTVSPSGQRKLVLKSGEHKAIHKDRIILVPGPKKEVDCIRKMFALADLRHSAKEIAKALNECHLRSPSGKPWDARSVDRLLTQEKYAGWNVYGKTTQLLSSASRGVEPRFWVTKPLAFEPIVDRPLFDRVQELINSRRSRVRKSDEDYVQAMKSLLAQEGKLTQKLLKTRNVFANTSYRRFGSAMGAYKLAGYVPPSKTTKLVQTQIRLRLLRQDLYLRLKQLFDKRLRFVSLAGQQLRRIIEIDGSQRVAVYICREINSMKNGERRWLLQLRSLDSHYPMLVCTVDELFSTFLDFYVVPSLRKIVNRYKQFGESKPLSSVSGSKKLGRLEDFIDVAQDVAYRSKNKDLYIAVDDIQLPLDTWMIAHKGREILLGPVGLAIFKMLASNAGQPVARAQLQRAFSKELLDRRNLTCHISSLRRKLGPEVRNRIQTVPGIGYMYVPPPMKNAAICTEVMEKGVP